MSVLWRTAAVAEGSARMLAEAAHLPLRVARWLCARGIEPEDALAYTAPEKLPPLTGEAFTELNQAVARLVRAVLNQETIVIVGDYDVDGVTSSAIVSIALKRLSARYTVEIPHRITDGYGLQSHIVERIADDQPALLVTVDNGIRANEAVSLAKSLGMDVIVTDHHEPGDELPQADAIVHWIRSVDRTQTAVLSGAGVAYHVSMALLDALGVSADDRVRSAMLGLAALGALADVMPLTGENRRLVKLGLAALERWSAPGWRALCETAGCAGKPLSERTLLWQITPRLNAAGRMASAKVAFDLLLAESADEAMALASEIERWNELRRKETERAFREAAALLPPAESGQTAVVAAGPWHLGVAGIVAARLVDAYGCPAIVLCDDGGTVLKGSGRAPDGISLYEALTQVDHTLHHFGGHDAAVGCGIERDRVAEFAEALQQAVAGADVAAAQNDEWIADDFLPLAEVTKDTADWLDRLAPYGPGFPPLQFYVRPVQISKMDWLKDGKHLRLTLVEEKRQVEAIWFNVPESAQTLTEGDWIAAMAEVTRNVWRGTERIQLNIITAMRLDNVRNRRDFVAVYRLLRARRQLDSQQVSRAVPAATEETAEMMLDSFVELGFATRSANAYHVVEYATPRDLRESKRYHDYLRQAVAASRSPSSEHR